MSNRNDKYRHKRVRPMRLRRPQSGLLRPVTADQFDTVLDPYGPVGYQAGIISRDAVGWETKPNDGR